MNEFLYGVAVCAAAGASLFFVKYWRETRDRFFLFFAAAFVMLALNWLLLVAHHPAVEYRHLVYMWRLGAFVLILAGIWDKNRRS